MTKTKVVVVCFIVMFLVSRPNSLTAQECVLTLKGHTFSISCLAISPDGKVVATGDSHEDKPGTIKLWDLAKGQELLTFRKHTEAISGIAFSPDGKRIASGSHEKKVRVWEAATGNEISVVTVEGTPWDPWFISDEKSLAIMPHTKPVELWDLSKPDKPILKEKLLSTVIPSGPVDFSCDRKSFAISFNYIPKQLLVERGEVIVYDMKTSKEQGRFISQSDALVECLALSTDGKKLAVGYDDKLGRLWNVKKGGDPMLLRGHKEHVMVTCFSPDSKLLATGDYSGVVKLWNAETGKEIWSLIAHDFGITGIVFTPDCKMMITSSRDKTAKIWNITPK